MPLYCVKNFVNFGPVASELTELICERLVWQGQKLAYLVEYLCYLRIHWTDFRNFFTVWKVFFGISRDVISGNQFCGKMQTSLICHSGICHKFLVTFIFAVILLITVFSYLHFREIRRVNSNGGSRHWLWYLKFTIFMALRSVLPYQMSKLVNPLRNCDFLFFQDSNCLPSWICLGHI